MSQLDFVHFLPSLVWIIVIFFVFYVFMVSSFVPEVYKIYRVRRNFLVILGNLVTKELYLAKLLHCYDRQLKEMQVVNCFKIRLKYTYQKMQILIKCI